jgi:importin subunit beta-1
VRLLCQELANESSQSFIRNAAGLALKNSLISSEAQKKMEYQQRWISIDENVKAQIKQMVLATLASPDARAALTAAQVVAAIASVELPLQYWPDLMKTMLDNVTSSDNAQLKQATLTAIGYVCEQIEPHILQPQSGAILTAVVQGARKEEPK